MEMMVTAGNIGMEIRNVIVKGKKFQQKQNFFSKSEFFNWKDFKNWDSVDCDFVT